VSWVCEWATGRTTEKLGFDSQQRREILLFSTVSRQALEHISCNYLRQEVKRPEREADHLPPSAAEVKNARSVTYTSRRSSRRSA
jgi:hypothetical protein